MRRRLQGVDDTRRRIIEAAVALHGSIGPAATTMSAVAQRAGVTRATLYRHFPTDADLLAASHSAWIARNPPPDVAAWTALADPVSRLRAGLADLYAWYGATRGVTANLARDAGSLPITMESPARRLRDEAGEALLPGWPSQAVAPLLAAALRHAAAFDTWRSLTADGLADDEAVELMVTLVRAAGGGSGPSTAAAAAARAEPARAGAARAGAARAKKSDRADRKAKGGRKHKGDRRDRGDGGDRG